MKFTFSAYLGSLPGGHEVQAVVAFQNASGEISMATLGPLSGGGGLSLQQQIGLVPPGATSVTVTLSFAGANAAADNLSLVLSALGGPPQLGVNLVANPGAEVGPSAPSSGQALYIPGWSTANVGIGRSGDLLVESIKLHCERRWPFCRPIWRRRMDFGH